mmetsp:Transcript_42943/g.96533  ORF Transcript_42943/g.96533 Transcript_42943/m.96533 type:complete len:209 (+) Transcript_42943:553-1179(+)
MRSHHRLRRLSQRRRRRRTKRRGATTPCRLPKRARRRRRARKRRSPRKPIMVRTGKERAMVNSGAQKRGMRQRGTHKIAKVAHTTTKRRCGRLVASGKDIHLKAVLARRLGRAIHTLAKVVMVLQQKKHGTPQALAMTRPPLESNGRRMEGGNNIRLQDTPLRLGKTRQHRRSTGKVRKGVQLPVKKNHRPVSIGSSRSHRHRVQATL